MAGSTGREFDLRQLRVRLAMTGLTGGDGLVLVGVTGGATLRLVLERTGGQKFDSFLMTSAAIGILDLVVFVGYGRRHMGLMTLFAVAGNHLGGVGFVTLGASRNFAVRIVTSAAKELAVLARSRFELLDLVFMTGQTGGRDALAIGDHFGSVRIAVALLAVRQFKMGTSGVTLITEGDDLADRRGMTVVAILTADLGLVRQALGFDVGGRLTVALDAVIVVEFGGSRCRCCHRNGREQKQARQEEKSWP